MPDSPPRSPHTAPPCPPLTPLPVFEDFGLQRGRAARHRSGSLCVEEEEGDGERHGAGCGARCGVGGPFIFSPPPSPVRDSPPAGSTSRPGAPGSPPMRCPNGGHPPWSLGKEGGRKGAECCHTARTSRPWVPPSPGRRRGEHRGDNGAGWGGEGGREGARLELANSALRARRSARCATWRRPSGAQAHAQQRRARRGGR